MKEYAETKKGASAGRKHSQSESDECVSDGKRNLQKAFYRQGFAPALDASDQIIESTTKIVRPDRKFPRKNHKKTTADDNKRL